MKKLFLSFLLLTSVFLLTNCSQKRIVHPEIQQQPEIQQPMKTLQESPEVKPEERITEQRLAKIQTKEELPKYIEEEDSFKDIYFDYDEYDIRPDAKPILQEVASWMLKNTHTIILIEGHCDERGTNEYNLALGDRRAKSTRDYLVALGIASNRIEMLSYGEEKPLCFEETEECLIKNRRAHFVILKEAGR
ncbi:MAG: peptidoglycan-associated lipoprotein [Nitrospirae bacterium RBG_13_39_12]|nr:MAG: peptidoglycan-associated lipoprotein [Nitrospirae bacterium RBG_13_39_12]